MHEFSLANQIVEKVLDLAKGKKTKKVASIEVSVGELTLLGEEEQVKFWLKELLNQKEITKDARIKLNTIKALVKCKKCGYEGDLKVEIKHDHSQSAFLCPTCGQGDLEIKRGRDCVIERIEVEM